MNDVCKTGESVYVDECWTEECNSHTAVLAEDAINTQNYT